jgi:hypothetical protein
MLRQPFGGRVPRNGKPEQLPATVTYDEKRKQALKCQGCNHAEIDCRNGIRVVAQECPPSLRRRPSHVFADRRFGDLEPELQLFTVDARGNIR